LLGFSFPLKEFGPIGYNNKPTYQTNKQCTPYGSFFGAFVIDIVVRLRKALNELNENVKILNEILDKMDVLNDNIEEDEEDDEEEHVDENDPEEIPLEAYTIDYDDVYDEVSSREPRTMVLTRLMKFGTTRTIRVKLVCVSRLRTFTTHIKY